MERELTIERIAVAGGEPHVVGRCPCWIHSLAWSNDGETLLFRGAGQQDQPVVLCGLRRQRASSVLPVPGGPLSQARLDTVYRLLVQIALRHRAERAAQREDEVRPGVREAEVRLLGNNAERLKSVPTEQTHSQEHAHSKHTNVISQRKDGTGRLSWAPVYLSLSHDVLLPQHGAGPPA
jgi:hypothetical protein